MKNREYFLTSRHGGVGSTVMFHNKDEQGYGSDLRNLEVYDADKAQKYHDQFGRGSLPLLASKVMQASKLRVDMQYVDYSKGMPVSDEDIMIVSVGTRYDGNDIRFMSEDGSTTYNACDAKLFFCKKELPELHMGYVPWKLDYINSIARPTLQFESINTLSMCRGIKLKRKYERKDSGKTRFNCPSCGKISWQFNPYDFEGCSDVYCEEWRA